LWSDWGSETRVMEILRKIGYAARLNGLPSTAYKTEPRQYSHRPFASLARTVKRRDHDNEELSISSRNRLLASEL